MKVLELFSGTGTLSATARAMGHEAFTIDLYEPADLQADVLDLTADGIRQATGWDHIDMVWASPICTGFSIAAVSHHWNNDNGALTPKSDTGRLSLALLEKAVTLIRALQPTTWYIENPRGMARKMAVVQLFDRTTVTFCQYGDTRMKPTDIWHNSPHWRPRPVCRNGDPCHERAPRGAKTGTQGIKGKLARAKLPHALCGEVVAASALATARLAAVA